MKRLLVGVSLAAGIAPADTFAQEFPAARLGRPAATLGLPSAPIFRGQEPELSLAQLNPIPKAMPKGTIGDDPKKESALPKPAPAAPSPGTVTGPVIIDPPMPGGPILSGPLGAGPYPIDAPPIPGATPLHDERWYTSAEFLLWYVRSYSVPPLVSAGAPNTLAAIGTGGASTIFGDNAIDANPRYGARISLGYWLCPNWALEGVYFSTAPATQKFAAYSDQYPNSALGRPFFSANRGTEFAEVVGLPGALSGNVTVDSKSTLWGAELNARKKFWEDCNSRLDFIVGYRFLSLEERLDIAESSRALTGQFAGLQGTVQDRFHTTSRFHGGQVGAIYERTWGRWTLDMKAKLAVGVSQQGSDISGAMTLSNGAKPNLPGGLLALESNSGLRTRSQIAFVPELGFTLGYDLTSHLRIFGGYNFMYWTAVARPGKQIDRTLDENKIPEFTTFRTATGTPNAPAATSVRPIGKLESESIWIQGVNIGLQFRW